MKKIKLSEVTEIVMGQSPKSEFFNSMGEGIEFLQGVRTFGDLLPYFDTYTIKYNREAKEGDILFSVRAPVGRLNWSDRTIAIGRGIAAIRSRGIDKNFLFYSLKNISARLDEQASGTIFTSISKQELSDIELIVPDNMEDQEKIGYILSVLDKKISVLRKINDNLVV